MKKILLIVVSIIFAGGVIFAGWFYGTLYISSQSAKHIDSHSLTHEELQALKAKDVLEQEEKESQSSNKNDLNSEKADQEVVIDKQEVSNNNSTHQTTKSGSFTKIDKRHYANGIVEAKKIGDDVVVSFDAGFEVANGPDLFIHLIPKQDIANLSIENSINLGELTSKSGKQFYKIPYQDFNENDYAVVIRCRAFSVLFSYAILE